MKRGRNRQGKKRADAEKKVGRIIIIIIFLKRSNGHPKRETDVRGLSRDLQRNFSSGYFLGYIYIYIIYIF